MAKKDKWFFHLVNCQGLNETSYTFTYAKTFQFFCFSLSLPCSWEPFWPNWNVMLWFYTSQNVGSSLGSLPELLISLWNNKSILFIQLNPSAINGILMFGVFFCKRNCIIKEAHRGLIFDFSRNTEKAKHNPKDFTKGFSVNANRANSEAPTKRT